MNSVGPHPKKEGGNVKNKEIVYIGENQELEPGLELNWIKLNLTPPPPASIPDLDTS